MDSGNFNQTRVGTLGLQKGKSIHKKTAGKNYLIMVGLPIFDLFPMLLMWVSAVVLSFCLHPARLSSLAPFLCLPGYRLYMSFFHFALFSAHSHSSLLNGLDRLLIACKIC